MNDTVLSIIGINVKLSPTVVYPHQNSYCACSGLICLLKEMTNYFPRTCIHLQQCDCHYLSCMYTSWLLRLPWSITANSVYCRHHSNSKVLNWYVWLLWFGLKCSFFLPPTPHPPFSPLLLYLQENLRVQSRKPLGMSQPFLVVWPTA